MATAALRGCPTCKTKVDAVSLGLRDYSTWVDLPGKEGMMDFDAVVEKAGRFLVMEFKPRGEQVALGQLITLKALVTSGFFDVWIVWHDEGEGFAEVGQLNRYGRVPFAAEVSVVDLAKQVNAWRNDGQAERKKAG